MSVCCCGTILIFLISIKTLIFIDHLRFLCHEEAVHIFLPVFMSSVFLLIHRISFIFRLSVLCSFICVEMISSICGCFFIVMVSLLSLRCNLHTVKWKTCKWMSQHMYTYSYNLSQVKPECSHPPRGSIVPHLTQYQSLQRSSFLTSGVVWWSFPSLCG